MPDSSPPTDRAPSDAGTVRLLNAIYQAYNAHDAEATHACYTPDLTVTINGQPGPQSRAAFVQALEEQWLGFPDVTATETGRVTGHDSVVTEMAIDGHNNAPFLGRAATGKRWAVTLAWVCKLREGRVSSIRVYIDNRSIQESVRP